MYAALKKLRVPKPIKGQSMFHHHCCKSNGNEPLFYGRASFLTFHEFHFSQKMKVIIGYYFIGMWVFYQTALPAYSIYIWLIIVSQVDVYDEC